MNDKALNLLGLMRKASSIALGEDNAGDAVRDGKAKLLLLASDASENAVKRAAGYASGRSVLTVPLPYTKEEIASAVGVGGCSMAAVTDMGFANALMELLSAARPEVYSELAGETRARLDRTKRRKAEKRKSESDKRNQTRRTDI